MAMLQGVDHTLLLLRHEYEKDSGKFDPRRLLQAATPTDGLIIQHASAGKAERGRPCLATRCSPTLPIVNGS
ncbi:MAG TPA: hypothetical protein VL976_13090 [Xanthobacteraceae bacterium]|nr:hypothetical protein [Xanthobacteraceae bacterium]